MIDLYLSLTNDEVNVQEILDRIDTIMKNRLRTATVKESLEFYKNSGNYPGFMELNLRFNPGVGTKDIYAKFNVAKEELRQEFKDKFFKKMTEICSEVLENSMKEAYETRDKAIGAMDIKDPINGPKRTELYKKFDEILTKYKMERAVYASNLRKRKIESDTKGKETPQKKQKEDNKRKLKLKTKKDNKQ